MTRLFPHMACEESRVTLCPRQFLRFSLLNIRLSSLLLQSSHQPCRSTFFENMFDNTQVMGAGERNKAAGPGCKSFPVWDRKKPEVPKGHMLYVLIHFNLATAWSPDSE